MKITLAKSAGFCFGVKRAIDIALENSRKHKNIDMLGDIVHNEEVVRQIEKSGVKKIKQLGLGKNKILLIRAHGAPKALYKKAQSQDYKIVDATCPMVKEIHGIARNLEKQGYSIIVIGDKKHDEVKGICGQLKKRAIVIEADQPLPAVALKKLKKAAIISQSTQNLERVLRCVEKIKEITPKVKFFNTICRPTQTKQEEIKTMPKENDVMIIIGSKTSANTKRLFELSREINPKTYWVNKAKNLKPSWFKNLKNVGVTAGASTPESTIQEVITALRKV